MNRERRKAKTVNTTVESTEWAENVTNVATLHVIGASTWHSSLALKDAPQKWMWRASGSRSFLLVGAHMFALINQWMLWSLSVVLKTVSFHVVENAFSHFSSPRNLNTLQAFAGTRRASVSRLESWEWENRALLITHLDWISTFWSWSRSRAD